MAPSKARKSSPTGTPDGPKVLALSRWVPKPRRRPLLLPSMARTTAVAPSRSTRPVLVKIAVVAAAAVVVADSVVDAAAVAAAAVAAAATAAAAAVVVDAAEAAAAVAATAA